jgi:hypothetical protein
MEPCAGSCVGNYRKSFLRPQGRNTCQKEVAMTRDALHISAIAFGVAALALMSPHSPASADPSATGATNPSLAEPAPTPTIMTSAPDTTTPATGAAEPPPRPKFATSGAANSRISRRPARHYARGYSHRYRDNNPVAAAATGVVGGVADLGAIAAYPLYCFPRYGSCPVYRPYP